MKTLRVIVGEAKNLLFRIRDANGAPVDLSDSNITFAFKLGIGTESGEYVLVEKQDSDFDKSNAENGEVSVVCPFMEDGIFYATLEINQGGFLLDKSKHRVEVSPEF